MDAAPMALARRANSVPMSPVPRTVMVLPMIDRMGCTVPQRWAAASAQYVISWRSSISVTMMRCSAMVTPYAPEELDSMTSGEGYRLSSR